jgi:hypothetical protein
MAATVLQQAAWLMRWGPFCHRALPGGGGGGGWCEGGQAAGAGSWCAVCMRPLAQRRHAAGEAWRVGAGGSAMASEANHWLSSAVEEDDVEGIAAALLAGADAHAILAGWSHLHRAAAHGHVAAMAALLAAGARVDAMDRNRETPLMYAAMQGHTAAVDALLAAGADVHHTITFGETALHRASMSAHLDTARALIEAGARTDVRDKSGKRPIDRVGAPAHSLAHLRRFCAHAPLRHCTVMHRFGRATKPPRVP